LVKPLPTCRDFAIVKTAAAYHAGFLKGRIFLLLVGKICVNLPICVTVPNFATIGQAVAEIWQFLFSKMASAAILDF